MSILVFFFTLIIVSISLNRINEYIKTLKTNESSNSGENKFIIPFDNKRFMSWCLNPQKEPKFY